MQYRQLGQTGITVSEIGFGAWGIGGGSYGPVEDAVSITALRRAFELGITFYDTSDLYGDGHSEKVIGEGLKPLREKVVIATKVGLLPHTGFDMPMDFSPTHIRQGLENSLRRLQTDYVDLYQLHSPTLELLETQPEILTTLSDLQAEGKIRAIGLSARSPKDAKEALKRHGFSVVQVNYNLIDHRAYECGLFALAKASGAGIIGRTPLCFGFLSGEYTEDTIFQAPDHRANWPREQIRRWVEAGNLFRGMASERGCSPAQFALRFCLAQPALSAVIPGILTPQEAEANAAASDLPPLSEEELTAIGRIYAAHDFYDTSAKKQAA